MHVLDDHPAICAIVACWLFSAFVGGMPDPIAGCSLWYTWAFKSLNILAANVGALMRNRFPNAPLPDCDKDKQSDGRTPGRPDSRT